MNVLLQLLVQRAGYRNSYMSWILTAPCRYQQLQQPTQLRKHRLMESLRVQQLFRDMEDEAAWIREKEPVAASTNRGTV